MIKSRQNVNSESLKSFSNCVGYRIGNVTAELKCVYAYARKTTTDV